VPGKGLALRARVVDTDGSGERMRVAAVQFKATRGDLQGSRARCAALALDAAVDADLVVLPEMACTGYIFTSLAEARRVAEPAEGETFRAWREVAVSRGCWVVGGMPEAHDGRLYNSALVISPAGELAFTYRKTLLYEADRVWASPGNSGYRRFATAAGSFGVGICMDLNDPRFLLWCWRSRLDAIAFPTNWVDEGQGVWDYWGARTGGSGAGLVAANTWGEEPGVAFTGRSAILDRGKVVASADPMGDAVIRARLGGRGA
jgi:predicted amidohydrolase